MRRALILLTVAGLAVAAAPASAGADPTIGATRAVSAESLRVISGSVSGPLEAMAVRDQIGADDDPEAAVTVTPGPAGFDIRIGYRITRPPAISRLDLASSFRSSPGGWWRLQVRDRTGGRWVTVQGSSRQPGGGWVWEASDLDQGSVLDGSGTVAVRLVGAGAPVSVDLLTIRRTVWQPAPGTTWHWQLTGDIDTSLAVAMYDIDLFETPVSVIDALHQQGRVVICYFSAGSWEKWRPDAGDFPAGVLGAGNGWPGERWLDIRRLRVLRPILEHRLDLAVAKGCDGVEPDNVDGYTNRTGFPLTAQQQIRFNAWLAAAAHRRGLSVGLKNDLEQIPWLVNRFDWALDEQCFQYDECELLLPFVEQDKAVFGAEYRGPVSDFCPAARGWGFSWLLKRLELDAWVRSC